MRANGVGLQIRASPWRHFEGFDFVDVAHRDREPFTPKRIKLLDNGEGWYHLVREINAVILFEPDSATSCNPEEAAAQAARAVRASGMFPAVKGRDLLAAPVSDIRRLVEQYRDQQGQDQQGWLLRGRLTWDLPGQAFRACGCGGPGPLFTRVQTLQTHTDVKKQRQRRQRDAALSPNVCEDGAVLFGHERTVLRNQSQGLGTGRKGASASVRTVPWVEAPRRLPSGRIHLRLVQHHTPACFIPANCIPRDRVRAALRIQALRLTPSRVGRPRH